MDYRKVYAENEADITAFAKENNIDLHNLADRRQLVKDWASATGYTVQKPNWFKQLISNIRIWFHNHGIMVKHFSDDDIANIIYRSAKAARDRRRTASRDGDGVRFSIIGGESELALFDNREKSQKVISALQKIANGSEEEIVSGLRNDLEQYGGTNDVTFYWGNEKKGIYHIAYRRGIDTLFRVIDAVADGKILRFVEGNKTVVLEKDGFEAVLALTEYGQQKSWLLSGWKVDKPDTNGEVGTQSAATQPEPTFSRQELGAGLLNNISQNPENASSTDKNGPSAAPDGAMEGKRTETDYSDYSDKSDGNGALFTLNSNASEELKLQVKAMQDCVGPFLDQDGAEYARRFKEKYGITIDPDEAIVIAQLAISENRSARQKYVAAQNAVNAWAYFKSFNPLFDFIVEFG